MDQTPQQESRDLDEEGVAPKGASRKRSVSTFRISGPRGEREKKAVGRSEKGASAKKLLAPEDIKKISREETKKFFFQESLEWLLGGPSALPSTPTEATEHDRIDEDEDRRRMAFSSQDGCSICSCTCVTLPVSLRDEARRGAGGGCSRVVYIWLLLFDM